MEIATTILLLLTFVLMPIPIKINSKIFLTDKFAHIQAKIWGIQLLRQHASINGGQIVLRGTLNMDIDIFQANFKNGIDFSKCLVLRQFYLSSNSNLTETNNMMVLNSLNTVISIAVPVVCRFTHVRVGALSQITTQKSNIAVEVLVTTSLLECAYSLIKQGVQKWNTK